MPENDPNLHDYAGGWIQERKHTEVPGFLRYAYIVIGIGCCVYFFLYMYGEETHAGRGALVRQFNAATQTSEGFMYAVGALAIVFFAAVIAYAFRKTEE